MGKIISIKNNKGGVGKTFFTAQLASGLAYLEKKSFNLNLRFSK